MFFKKGEGDIRLSQASAAPSMAFVWKLGVAGLISKGAFQCPQLYFENRIENAIKVETHFENLVSEQDSKRDQKRPQYGLKTASKLLL